MAKGQSRLDITKMGKGIGINLDHGMNMTQKAICFGLNITRRYLYQYKEGGIMKYDVKNFTDTKFIY
jgi:hypothetical protein